MSAGFAAAYAKGDAPTLAQRCLEQLPPRSDANLGILYVTEAAAPRFAQVVLELAIGTGIANWVGGVGLGLCAGGEEVYDRPAAAVLTACLPDDKFRLFAPTDDPAADLPRAHAQWIEAEQPSLALVHADRHAGRNPREARRKSHVRVRRCSSLCGSISAPSSRNWIS